MPQQRSECVPVGTPGVRTGLGFWRPFTWVPGPSRGEGGGGGGSGTFKSCSPDPLQRKARPWSQRAQKHMSPAEEGD